MCSGLGFSNVVLIKLSRRSVGRLKLREHCLFFFFFFKIVFVYLRERESTSREEGQRERETQTPPEQRAGFGAPSQDPEILT